MGSFHIRAPRGPFCVLVLPRWRFGVRYTESVLEREGETDVSLIYLIMFLLVAGAVISLILSFLGILVVGALRLLPLVLVALLLLVLLGKIKIGVSDGRRPGRR